MAWGAHERQARELRWRDFVAAAALVGGVDGVACEEIIAGRLGEGLDIIQDLSATFDGRLYLEIQPHPGTASAASSASKAAPPRRQAALPPPVAAGPPAAQRAPPRGRGAR